VSYKLLLADDSVTIQKVIELTFADEDIDVIAVSTGSQAIARAPVDRPDIVLADVGMPDRDGYEVAAFIKRTPGLSHIPVLLLTGAFEPIDEGRAKAAGCDGVLVKPFEPQMVITRVKDLIAGKRPLMAGGTQGAAQGSSPLIRPATPPPVPADQYFDRLDAAIESREAGKGASTGAAAARPTPADLARELAHWQPDSGASTPATLSGSAPTTTPSPSAPSASGSAPSAPASAPSAPASAPSGAASAPSAPATAPSAPATAPSAPASAPSASASAPSAPDRPPSLAQAFAALLAAEQGKVAPPPAISEEALRDDVIEQVTRRVVERMTDTAVRDVVVEVAERLVREEITRIKGQAR
jgi:CheY-like chemotaxis protein